MNLRLRRAPLLLLLVLAACGDDDVVIDDMGPSPTDAGTDAGPVASDAATDAGPEGCTPMTVGDFELDVISDTGLRVVAPLDPEIEEQPWRLNVWFQRFGDAASEGIIPLGEAPNDDFPDCPHCVIALQGVDLNRGFFATEGTMELREDPFGPRVSFVLEGVVLTEVTIGPGERPGTISVTPVPDGKCLELPRVEVDGAFPPDEWTCGVERWADGTACDCGCGTWDPDCFPCDEFPPDPTCDPTPLPLVGCADGQVCTGQDAECAVDCSETGVCGFGTCVYWLDGQRICESDTDRFDPARLGEPCTDPIGLTYCAEDVGVANGVCAQWVDGDVEEATWECRPVCTSDADCDAAEFERCEMIFGETAGYCIPDYPPSWTCHPSLYDDGATCHCGCGLWDPDCGDTHLAPSEAVGCDPGDVCVPVDQIRTWSQSECVTPPANSTCATAEVVTLPYDQTVNARGAAPDYMAASCFPSEKWGFDLVWAVDLAVGDALRVEAIPATSDYDPTLYIIGPGDPSVCEGDFSCVAQDDNARYGETETTRHVATEAGTHYVVLDSFAPRSGDVRLTMSLE